MSINKLQEKVVDQN